MMNIEKPAIGIRIASMLLDHLIMGLILVLPVILFRPQLEFLAGPGGLQLVLIGQWIIYCFKDSLDGKSIAKRLFSLQVVDNKRDATATVGQCFVRNISTIIWPVEVIVALFNPDRRIGDFIASTKLVTTKSSV